MTKYVICVDIGCEDIQTPYLSVLFCCFFGIFRGITGSQTSSSCYSIC